MHAALSIRSHLQTQHGVFQAEVLDEEYLEDRPSRTYRATQSADGKFRCPVPGCVGEASSKWNLRRHFCDRHPLDYVDVPGEGVYDKCVNCRMQTSPFARSHHLSAFCRETGERQRQYDRRVQAALALRQQFHADGDVLGRVEVFKYLGRLLSQHDDDAQAVRAQMVKARKCWARVGRVLRGENASPRVVGFFYKAVVQSILLYGSESWVLGPQLLARLEGFHIRAAWRMAKVHKPRRGLNGVWIYPQTADVLEEVGLESIEEYIRRRRQTIVAYVVDRPIFQTCMRGERMSGSPPHHGFWWEQEMDLDEYDSTWDGSSDSSISSETSSDAG